MYRYSDGTYHRAIPDFLIPYKHYTVQVIQDALSHDIDLDQYSFPSDSSFYRWEHWFTCLLLIISRMIASAVVKPADDAHSLLQMLRNRFSKSEHNCLKNISYTSDDGWLAQLVTLNTNDFEFLKL